MDSVLDGVLRQDTASAFRAGTRRAGRPDLYVAENERTNLELVRAVCGILDELSPAQDGRPYQRLISHVGDRAGHDRRYAIDSRKIRSEIGWKPAENFESGMRKTVAWYLANRAWTAEVTSREYRKWVEKNYSRR